MTEAEMALETKALEIMLNARACLRCWAACFGATDKAKQHVEETRAIMDAIDDWMLKL